MSGPTLWVSRAVIEDTIRLAALEVPGVCRVGRGGAAWARWVAGPAIRIERGPDSVAVSVTLVARPAQPLVPLTRSVRAAVTTAVERTLDLEAGPVTVIVDGVGS